MINADRVDHLILCIKSYQNDRTGECSARMIQMQIFPVVDATIRFAKSGGQYHHNFDKPASHDMEERGMRHIMSHPKELGRWVEGSVAHAATSPVNRLGTKPNWQKMYGYKVTDIISSAGSMPLRLWIY